MTGTSPNRPRVHIVHNWSWQPTRVETPVQLSDVVDGATVPAGAAVALGPWDIRVFASER
jgi:beta-galactosidase